MPRITLGLGTLLVLVGVIAYVATAFASWTALIPAILGVVLFVSGLLARRRQKLGIHVALAVAVLGILGTSMNVAQVGALVTGDAERPVAVITSTITFVLLLVYVVLGIRSFMAARRWTSAQA